MMREGISDDRIREARLRVDAVLKALRSDDLYHLVFAARADLAHALEAKDEIERRRHVDGAETHIATALGTLNRSERGT